MSFTYVIPDIHGRDDLLGRALADISAHSGGEGGVIVMIGDYVDKGPHSQQVIERLLSGIDGWNLVALKGNHDAMMVQALRDQGLRDPAKLAFWIEKGGDTALASYGGDPSAVPEAHIAWLDQLRLMYVDAHRVYVHAGVDPELSLEHQSEDAIRKDMAQASARATSFTATTMIPTARCCSKAAPISIPWPGERAG